MPYPRRPAAVRGLDVPSRTLSTLSHPHTTAYGLRLRGQMRRGRARTTMGTATRGEGVCALLPVTIANLQTRLTTLPGMLDAHAAPAPALPHGESRSQMSLRSSTQAPPRALPFARA
eukprot:5482641-Prymnesium_polylepis.1